MSPDIMEEKRNKQEIKELPLREIIEQYTHYWYLFVLSAIAALILAFIYLRYTTALYQTRATIIIKDEKSASSPMEMAAFSQFGSFLSRFNTSKIDNELAIFNSKRIISKTVEELGL
ncbi:MAG: tyrosine protein kinase, partial [Aequorivita sp.]|nr:tyrosine protein kinase [Aequorivita sp.]